MTDEVFHEMFKAVQSLGTIAYKSANDTTEDFDDFSTEIFGLIEKFLAPYADRIKDGEGLMHIMHGLLLLTKEIAQLKEKYSTKE